MDFFSKLGFFHQVTPWATYRWFGPSRTRRRHPSSNHSLTPTISMPTTMRSSPPSRARAADAKRSGRAAACLSRHVRPHPPFLFRLTPRPNGHTHIRTTDHTKRTTGRRKAAPREQTDPARRVSPARPDRLAGERHRRDGEEPRAKVVVARAVGRLRELQGKTRQVVGRH